MLIVVSVPTLHNQKPISVTPMPTVGLKNLGHTCFLNTVAQIFIELPGVSDLFSVDALGKYLPTLSQLRGTHSNMKQLYVEKLINSLKGALHTGYRGRARSASSFLEKLLADAAISSSSVEVNRAVEPSMVEHLLTVKHELAKGSDSAYAPLSFYLSFLAISPDAQAFHQHDVSEFYHFLIDRMHSELVAALHPHRGLHGVTFAKGDFSPVSHFFRGTVVSETSCRSCGVSEPVESPFIDLALEIPTTKIPLTGGFTASQFTVEDCLAAFFDPRRQLCPACRVPRAVQTTLSFGEAPQILVLNLGRANFEMGRGATKNKTFVSVPERLQLGGLCRRPGSCKYELAGAVLHHGEGSGSGHYTCYVKKGAGWLHCNDTDVEPLKGMTIEHALRTTPHSTSQPCLLFYSRIAGERIHLPLLQNFKTT